MNNKNIIIVIFILVLGVGYFIFSNSEQNNDKLRFDIDLENLSYQLPAHSLVCIPESKQFCTSDNECESIKAEVFLLVDEINNTYSRCDNKPCNTYDANFNKSGIYTIINPLPPHHGEVKIEQDGTYTETNSLGDSVYISRGACQTNI